MRVPSPAKWLRTSIASIAAMALAGCGASYTSIYEGDVRFEHCYRLDEEPSVPVAQKRACWQSWAKYYTYGQTRDRVEYAMSRDRALAEASMNERDAKTAPKPVRAVAAPTPTNAFAPPPQTMPREDAGAPADAAAPSAPDEPVLANAPGSSCASSCGRTWKKCTGGCESAACNVRCDDKYRGCMRGCF
jgi:hypothetical protein